MSRPVALAFVVVLVCSLPAIAVPGPIGPAETGSEGQANLDEDAIDWLTLSDGPAASGDGYVAIDVGATLDDDVNRLETRYEEYRIDARMETADSDAERRAIIHEEASQLSESVTQLRERERTAYEEYYEGDRSERELLAELAVVHTNAAVLDDSVSSLEDHAGGVPGVSFDERIERMEVETLTMQGPVREQVAEMMRGESPATTVYVETDGEGIVLAMVEGEEFHREAHRIDHRDPDAETQYTSLGESEDRIAELYPEVFSEARWSYSEVGYSTHRGVGNHAQGSLTVFLDTGTGEVYREYQTLRVDRIDTTPVEREAKGGVEATVEQAAPGGPAKVTLTDAETEAPLSGEVALDNRTVEETNDAGEVWFVAPRDSMTITASVGSATVEITISEDTATARTSDDDNAAESS